MKKQETLKEFLTRTDLQGRIDELAEKYKNKTIMLYGAGKVLDIILRGYYDLSKLNIIGITDKKLPTGYIFKGYNTYDFSSVIEAKPDVILITMLKAEEVIKNNPINSDFQYETFIKNSDGLDNVDIVREPLALYKTEYNGRYLATFANCDFLADPLFKKSYELCMKSTRYGIDFTLHWNIYFYVCFAKQALSYEGDFVECGVCTGGGAKATINYLDFKKQKGRKYWLFDTYKGLDIDSCHPLECEFAKFKNEKCYNIDRYEEICQTFSGYDFVKIVRGNVIDTLEQFSGDKVAFLSIDMNCLAPEIKAINYFWDKVVKGGIILLDDYGWPDYLLQKLGMEDFARKVGAQIISLPTGQGLIIKPY